MLCIRARWIVTLPCNLLIAGLPGACRSPNCNRDYPGSQRRGNTSRPRVSHAWKDWSEPTAEQIKRQRSKSFQPRPAVAITFTYFHHAEPTTTDSDGCGRICTSGKYATFPRGSEHLTHGRSRTSAPLDMVSRWSSAVLDVKALRAAPATGCSRPKRGS